MNKRILVVAVIAIAGAVSTILVKADKQSNPVLLDALESPSPVLILPDPVISPLPVPSPSIIPEATPSAIPSPITHSDGTKSLKLDESKTINYKDQDEADTYLNDWRKKKQ